MNNKIFRFESVLQKGKMSYLFVVPKNIVLSTKQKGRFRINGNVNNCSFNLAIQKTKEGIFYISIGNALRKNASIKEHEVYEIKFSLADAEELNIPETAEAVINQDEAVAKFWNSLTTGKKRSFLVYINSSKNPDIQIKRIYEIFEKYSKGELYSQKNKTNKP